MDSDAVELQGVHNLDRDLDRSNVEKNLGSRRARLGWPQDLEDLDDLVER